MRTFRRIRRRKGKPVRDRFYTGEHQFEGDARPTRWALRVTDKRVLYELRWSHLFLHEDNPRVVVPASLMKNREDHVQPLRDDLVAALQAMRPEHAKARDRVFGGILPRWGIDFLRNDLKAAGIPFEDEQGREFVFHALRHTAATMAGATGGSIVSVQGFMSRKTVTQTSRYIHDNQASRRLVVDRLPRFDQVGTGIGTVDLVAGGHNVSHVDTPPPCGEPRKSLNLNGKRREVAQSVTVGQTGKTMTPTGFEPVFSG